MAIIRKTITHLGENLKKLESSFIAGGNVKRCSHFGKKKLSISSNFGT